MYVMYNIKSTFIKITEDVNNTRRVPCNLISTELAM